MRSTTGSIIWTRLICIKVVKSSREKALKDGYRDKIYMATKSPIWLIKKYDDFEKYLDEELVRLGTDHIDVYLLHNLNYHHWETVKKYDGLRFLDKMIEKGKILYKGFFGAQYSGRIQKYR